MTSRALDSPVLAAFMRALTFTGLTEAIFFRLLPDPPQGTRAVGWLQQIHASLNRAGSLTFFLAFFVVVLSLVHVAYRTLRWRIWPAGLNGFLSTCLLCLAALGFVALLVERGEVFALGFTVVALLTLIAISMHAFAVTGATSVKWLSVLYCAAAICSAIWTAGEILASLGGQRLVRQAGLAGAVSTGATQAGRLLLAGSAVAAFLSFSSWWEERGRRRVRMAPSLLLGALAGGAYAAGSLLAPDSLSVREAGAGPAAVAILSWTLFLGVTTASMNMMQPRRGPLAYGLLLMVLAGFPLRIAYQQMLSVLGAVLVFAPEPPAEVEAVTPARLPGDLPV